MSAPLTIEDLGVVLGVWAHPDDEAYLSAGLMALARLAGHRVVVATATRGELGTPDPVRWPPSRLAGLRTYEAAASLAALDVHEHHWLGYADGSCADVPLTAGAEAVGRLIANVAPQTIVTFGPDGMTGHPDHRAVSAWTTAAWQESGRRARLLYATMTPRFHAAWGHLNDRVGLWMTGEGPSTEEDDLALLIRADEDLLDRKLAALRAHASQTKGLIDLVGEDDFRLWWTEEAFRPAVTTRAPSARSADGALRS